MPVIEPTQFWCHQNGAQSYYIHAMHTFEIHVTFHIWHSHFTGKSENHKIQLYCLSEKSKLHQSMYYIHTMYYILCITYMHCEFQRWSSQVCNMPKLRLYCKFKEDKQEELYLSLPIPMRLRRDLARFRTTSHNLEVEMGRHNNISFEDRLCQLCGRSNIFCC